MGKAGRVTVITIVSDYGSKMFNREVADGKDTIYESIHQNIMGIVIHEIDGDGEDLRQIKHLLLQTNEFNDHRKNWPFSDSLKNRTKIMPLDNILIFNRSLI